jgi:drug/metabolite transporter (DMT)-like permease
MVTDTAVFFGNLGLRTKPRQPLSSWAWTLVGGLAIPLWATWPALSLQTRQVPAFECLTIVFLVGWLVLTCMERPYARRISGSSGRSWIPALAFAFGESGSAVFFLWATHYIPAAEANLIMYLWPGMTVGLGAALGIFHLQLRHVMGIALGFLGAAILIGGGPLSISYVGLGLALLAGIAWALYCVFRLRRREISGPFLARGFGISALLCCVMHCLLEASVMPSIGSAAAAAIIGIVPTAFANLAWDEGFRRGDSRLLAVMAYATPLCSALLLAVTGLESFTWKLVIAAIVIMFAGAMSRADG